MIAAPSRENAVRLSDLLRGIAQVAECDDCLVSGLQIDSRRIGAGDLFVACRGLRVHAVSHVAEALRRGAVAVVYDPEGANGVHPLGVPAIAVPGLGERVSELAARFFGDPSHALRVVGVTGTNGKTSCTHYLSQALQQPTVPCGMIGTLGSGLYGTLEPGVNTTPDVVSVHSALAGFRSAGARWAVMEVSSHALDQGRVGGVRFSTAVFTNLTHDHLDYHGDMAAYEAAKRRLFTWPELEAVVINVDDPVGRRLIRDVAPKVRRLVYGLNAEAVQSVPQGEPLYAEAVELNPDGVRLTLDGAWGGGVLQAPLLGRFNASNLLAVLGVLLLEGWSVQRSLQRLAETRAVPGRMECFGGGSGAGVVVDYAHTPDALRQALSALHEHCAGELWCVFGCGGDRDRGKRPVMGRIAEELARYLIVTDDNPRGENGDDIVRDIRAGLERPEEAVVERDRDAAIRLAYSRAAREDMVLVAGKGHEAYQEVAGKRLVQSDRELVRELTGGDG